MILDHLEILFKRGKRESQKDGGVRTGPATAGPAERKGQEARNVGSRKEHSPG